MVQWSADDMPSVRGDGSDCEAWKMRGVQVRRGFNHDGNCTNGVTPL